MITKCETVTSGQACLAPANKWFVGASVIGGFMALQKLCALLQQVVIGRQWGVGEHTDAFFVAQVIPILLGGQLCASITSALVSSGKGQGPLECRRTAGASLVLFGFMSGLAALLASSAEPMVRVIGGGFSADRHRECVRLLEMMLPLLPLQAGAAILTAQAYVSARFLIAAVAGLAVPIGGALGAVLSGSTGFHAIVLGTLAGAVCQIGILMSGCRSVSVLSPIWDLPYCARVIKRAGAVFLSLSVGNGYVLIDRWMAGHGNPGDVAAVAFACSVLSVPGSLIVTAIGSALLPTLTRCRNVRDEFSSHSVVALKVSLCLWMSGAIAFVVAKPLIMDILFSRRTNATVGPTAALLTMYLPAYLGLCIRDTFATIAVALDRAALAAQIGIAGVVLCVVTKIVLLHPFSLGNCAAITGGFSLAVAAATAVATVSGGRVSWPNGWVWALKLTIVSTLAVGIGVAMRSAIGADSLSVTLSLATGGICFFAGCAMSRILPTTYLRGKVAGGI